MKVLQVSTWRVHCGIAGYTAALHDALIGLGVDVDVLPIDREATAYMTERELVAYFDDFASRAAGHDVVHIQHEFGFFAGAYGMQASIANFGRLLRRVRARAGRVVVTFHSFPPQPRLAGAPLRSWVRETLLHRGWRRRVLGAFHGRRAALAIAPSRILRRSLIDSGLAAARVSHVPQGVPAPFALQPAERARVRAELGYSEDDHLLVCFGFLAAYKGPLVAVDALRDLPARYKLALVGDVHPNARDLTMEKVLARIGARRLGDRALVTGYVPESKARAYLAAADTCLLPYIDDSLATSAAASWALASGQPTIASGISAFKELSETSRALRLVTPEAPRLLARAILALDDDPLERARLRQAALAHAAANNWESIARQHLALYGAALEPAGAAMAPAPVLVAGEAAAGS